MKSNSFCSQRSLLPQNFDLNLKNNGNSGFLAIISDQFIIETLSSLHYEAYKKTHFSYFKSSFLDSIRSSYTQILALKIIKNLIIFLRGCFQDFGPLNKILPQIIHYEIIFHE